VAKPSVENEAESAEEPRPNGSAASLQRRTPARTKQPAATSEAPGAATAVARKIPRDIDLGAPELYLNRELTWLRFNRRVLAEAQNNGIPLLERLKFLAITSSNMDEFFMKRIGGLKQQIAAGVHQLTVDGRTPEQQVLDCVEAVNEIEVVQRQVFLDLVKSLRDSGVRISKYEDLAEAEREDVRATYRSNILPLITPWRWTRPIRSRSFRTSR